MIDRRINIPKAHVSLIESLIDEKDSEVNGPFKTKASVLAFAAALGASDGNPIPFSETAGDPIRKSVFITAGYESLINILAVSSTNDPKVLSNTDEMEEQRAQIFEGYANRVPEHTSECSERRNRLLERYSDADFEQAEAVR